MENIDYPKAVNRERLVGTFTELIRINSPSFMEKEIGEVLAGKLQACGCAVEMQDYGRSFNLIASKRGTVSGTLPLLLSGHMDTIEPTEGILYEIDNGVIRSTGNTVLGSDDKSALAQILEALVVLQEQDIPHGDLEIVFTSAEEKGLVGAKGLDFSGIRSRHALVLDSSGGVGSLVVAAPSHYTYQMKVEGKAAHAGIEPEKGISAIRAAGAIVSAIPDGRMDKLTTANIGLIRGGTATNVVPKEVVLDGEVRSHDPEILEKIKAEISERAHEIALSFNAQVHISGQEEYRSFRIPEDDPFLKLLDRSFTSCGINPLHVVTGGGSDANVFNKNGITAINLSTGMQKVHSTEEYIAIDDLYKGTLVVLKTIADWTGFTV